MHKLVNIYSCQKEVFICLKLRLKKVITEKNNEVIEKIYKDAENYKAPQ